jgi:hypothetical protein
MPNRSPLIITPLPSPAERKALFARLDTAVTKILQADEQELEQSVHSRLIERLTEATLFAKKGVNLSGAAALDQSTLAATGMEITDAQLTKQQSKSAAQRLARAARTVAARVRTAPQRSIQHRRPGPGRAVDVWKGTLLDDVERALREAGVHRCYWATEQEAAPVLQDVFRACAAATDQPLPGDLRNIQRRRFRPKI